MANQSGTALSAVLPLPPLEYDVQYFNNMVRILNFFIQQVNNPGQIRGSALYLSDGDPDGDVIIDTRAMNPDQTKFIVLELPTSATGLEVGQIWNDSGTLKIVT